MPSITATPLSPEGFALYGEVFDPGGVTTRVDHVAQLDNRRAAARPNLFMALSGVVALPHAFTRMESHPWSSQSFAPFGTERIVIAVALPGADARPDLATLRAFVGGALGFSYRAGVWHLPVASLERPATVLGFMYEDGTPEDCVWADVAPSVIRADQSLARST